MKETNYQAITDPRRNKRGEMMLLAIFGGLFFSHSVCEEMSNFFLSGGRHGPIALTQILGFTPKALVINIDCLMEL